MDKEEKSKLGKTARRKGAEFERRVRLDLENRGWIVSKWANTIEYGRIIPAKWNRFRWGSTGFPDFLCFRKTGENYEVILVESKMSKLISRKEKEMIQNYLKRGIKCFIAYKGKIGEVRYLELEENK